MSKEIFREIKGFPDYEVSNTGFVVSWKNGYRRVGLYKNGRRFLKEVYRLVIETFGPLKLNPTHERCHNDGVPLNNHISNLRWDTHRNNMADKRKHGTLIVSRGSKQGLSKLAEEDVVVILKRFSVGESGIEITKDYPVCHSSICKIIKKTTWGHVLVAAL